VGRRARFNRRAEQLARAIATSLAERPVLCDLMSAQAAVLEHNVSAEVITRHKLAGLADAELLTRLVGSALPELSDDDAWKYAIAIWLMTAALWAHARPPQVVLEAHAAEKRLVRTQLDFPTTLADYLETLATGLHTRASHAAARSR
jgi:hypothetical protein